MSAYSTTNRPLLVFWSFYTHFLSYKPFFSTKIVTGNYWVYTVVSEWVPRILIDEHDYGTYDAIKAIVEIHAPYEQFSECKLFNYSTINVLSPLQSLLKQTKKEEMTLSGVTPTPMPMPPTITPISVGDIAQLTNE